MRVQYGAEKVRFACRLNRTRIRTHTHTQNMLYLLLFHCNSVCPHVCQCYCQVSLLQRCRWGTDPCQWVLGDRRFVWACLSHHQGSNNHRLIQWEVPQKSGPGSVVGIATGYVLDGPGDRIPVGARFSAPVQTGPGANPVSCQWVGGLSRG